MTSTTQRLTAADIAAALGQPPPTDEQAAAIESPAPSCLVVAGAGSGKTETMAGRVVWLVANGIVTPNQVLGLTFTRKAAAELAARIRRRLTQLAAHGLVDVHVVSAADPTISTYDAYAGRIVAENALRLGREPGQRLIPQTVAWQYARRAVDAYDGPMDDVNVTSGTVTNEVRSLAENLAQHRVDDGDLRAYCERTHAMLSALPEAVTKRPTKAATSAVQAVTAALAARCQLLPLVADYRAAKRSRECLDFADQMALAADLAEGFPEVAAAERATFRAVLLDEYQDTSHAQLVFLRALFGGWHDGLVSVPLVTAVGDPSQAIYGWRGASQGTLTAFPPHFANGAAPASVLSLSTSFRNSGAVLEVANAVAAPLRDGAVSTPVLRPRDGATAGQVRCALYPTVADEAEAVAAFIDTIWTADGAARAAGEGGRSIAVLVRLWRQLPLIEAALRARGIPLEILGVGGLLLEPDVVDVVATLRVLADPTRGDALMRLLTGSRWRIGARDLVALDRWARHLARHGGSSTGASEDGVGGTELRADPGELGPDAAAPDRDDVGQDVVAPDPADVGQDVAAPHPDDVDERSIIDALDVLPPRSWLSAQGYPRLSRLSAELRALRGRLAQPLPDLVADVVATMGLDVEVLARVSSGGTGAPGRANLDRLIEVAAEFAAGGDDIGVLAFLDYLDAAATEERGLDRPDEPESSIPEARQGIEVRADRVQLLTVHAAKGLEWDVVCVPGLVTNVFPSMRTADFKGWLTQRGSLPWPLRGDREGLPVAVLDGHADHHDVVAAVKEFSAAAKAHMLGEERRLAYVAATRARKSLLCTGFRWDHTKSPREASPFLDEVREVCTRSAAGVVECWTPLPDEGTTNPTLVGGPPTARWPIDPIAGRRDALTEAAALVSAAMDAALPVLPEVRAAALPVLPEVRAAMAEWDRDIDVLLAERASRSATGRLDVELPRHLSVSQLVSLRRDPAALALQLRRPVPAAPAPLARRGTAFHLWLEQRFSAPRLLDLDEVPGAADADAAPDAGLAALQQAFLGTQWATRDPVEVEVPFEIVVDDIVVRGRMDAVFRDSDGGFTVVDWKTGMRPAGADATAAAVQLAAYRLAWAELTGTDLGAVRAVFCYLRDGHTIAPTDLLDRAGLVEILASVAPAAARNHVLPQPPRART